MRILLALLALATPRGKPCDANNKCPAPLECVKTRGGTTCEKPCHPSQKSKQGDCPDDQRCVKDGDQHICRPIDDSVM